MTPGRSGGIQLLTILGLCLTVVIAIGGFRTFSRWRREQLEAKRIDIAYEALALAHESKLVFDHIRSGLSRQYEWNDMPRIQNEDDADRGRRGPFYATLKRIDEQKDFFARALKLHPKLIAIFGSKAEAPLMSLHSARREIEIAAEMLYDDALQERPSNPELDDFYKQLRADIWKDAGAFTKEGDRVGAKLKQFQDGIEALCRAVVDQSKSSL